MKPIAIGECDACPVEGDVFEVVGSKMRLCMKCYQAEMKVIQENKSFNQVMATANKVDSNITLKADIFNAATVSFIELKTSIMMDETIPADKKNEVFVQQCEARIKNYNDVIFAEKAATMIKENERASLVTQTREFISSLQAEQREKFKKYDINYTPAPASKKSHTTKPVKAASNKVTFSLAKAKEAAAKYGVPVAGIQSMVLSRNMPYEDAAKELAKLMGVNQ